MNTIAVIPARGGSRRIPKKAIRKFHGLPIIAYSIGIAEQTGIFQEVMVSTDDDEIAAIAERYGAIVHSRKPEYALDEVGTQEVMKHVLDELEAERQMSFDVACCIYPCAPLLNAEDLLVAYWRLTNDTSLDYVISVGYPPLHDAGAFYMGQASAFVTRVPLIGRTTTLYRLPPERDCDINTEEDWVRAEKLYADRMD